MSFEKQYNFTASFEDEIDHMYVDTDGNITVGIGCKLSSVQEALALPFELRSDIAADYARLRALPSGKIASWYRKFCNARLNRDAIRVEFYKRCADFERQLKKLFPEWDEYPEPARIGLMDLGFNVGVNELRKHWPSLQAAVRSRRWDVVAVESHRAPPVSEARNLCTAALFRSCVVKPLSNV